MKISDNPLFLLPIIIGAIFIIAGILMYLFPPKKINFLYGYRTKNSMKNIQTWSFAQKYSSKILVLTGFIFTLISIPGYYIQLSKTSSLIISIFLLFAFCGILYFVVEKAIKQKFNI